ncbi:hypothetical protein QI30_19370, partial [Kurthia sp. 3B1D]
FYLFLVGMILILGINSKNAKAASSQLQTPSNLKLVSKKADGAIRFSPLDPQYFYKLESPGSTRYSVKFKWGKVKGASYYKFVLYNRKTKKTEVIEEVNSNQFDSDEWGIYLVEGYDYKFKVKAIKDSKGKKKSSSYSKPINVSIPYDVVEKLIVMADEEEYDKSINYLIMSFKNTGRRTVGIGPMTFYPDGHSNPITVYAHVLIDSKFVQRMLFVNGKDINGDKDEIASRIYPFKNGPILYTRSTKITFTISDNKKLFLVEGSNNQYFITEIKNSN